MLPFNLVAHIVFNDLSRLNVLHRICKTCCQFLKTIEPTRNKFNLNLLVYANLLELFTSWITISRGKLTKQLEAALKCHPQPKEYTANCKCILHTFPTTVVACNTVLHKIYGCLRTACWREAQEKTGGWKIEEGWDWNRYVAPWERWEMHSLKTWRQQSSWENQA